MNASDIFKTLGTEYKNNLTAFPRAIKSAMNYEANPIDVLVGAARSSTAVGVPAAVVGGVGYLGASSVLAANNSPGYASASILGGGALAIGGGYYGYKHMKGTTKEAIGGMYDNAKGKLGTFENVGRKVNNFARSTTGLNKIDDLGSKYANSMYKKWNKAGGPTKVAGNFAMGGMLLGGLMSSFKLNRGTDIENSRRVEEQGSAYEGGAKGFGAPQRMPYASGKLTLGLQNRRHG